MSNVAGDLFDYANFCAEHDGRQCGLTVRQAQEIARTRTSYGPVRWNEHGLIGDHERPELFQHGAGKEAIQT